MDRRAFLALTTAALASPAWAKTAAQVDRLVLSANDRMLIAYQGNRALLKLPTSLGENGVGKEKQGDRLTPVGEYRVMRGRRSVSGFYRFLPVSYPNIEDATRGLAAGLINNAEFKKIVKATKRGAMPPQHTKLGGLIGIHGVGDWAPRKEQIQFVSGADWTWGCIGLTDDHLDALEKLIRPGVRFVIQGDPK